MDQAVRRMDSKVRVMDQVVRQTDNTDLVEAMMDHRPVDSLRLKTDFVLVVVDFCPLQDEVLWWNQFIECLY